jgi:hypothetical protein
VDPQAHLHLDAVRPAGLLERPLGVGRSRDGVPRPCKGDEDRLGRPVDDHSLVRGERLFQQPPVLRHHLLVGVAQAMLELRRALDVGK